MVPSFMRLLLLVVCMLVVCAGCAPDGSTFGQIADEPELAVPCPVDMRQVEGGTGVLGENPEDVAEGDEPFTLYAAEYELPSFCVQTYPFPGELGDPWPDRALFLEELDAVQARLAPTGRRLCDVTELLLASASWDNWRYSYHPEDRQEYVCESNVQNPTPNELGAWEHCVAPTGAHDFNVRRSWAKVTYDTIVVMSPHQEDGSFTDLYTVVGGTSETNTVHPDTNFAIQSYGPGLGDSGDTYWDMGLRLCKDVSPDGLDEDEEAAWDLLHDGFVATGATFDWLVDPPEGNQ